MGLVDDYGEVAVSEFPVGQDLLHRVRESLDGHHDDGGATFQSFGKFLGLADAAVLLPDGRDQILLMIDLLDCVLELLVEHRAIGDHDDRVEQVDASIGAQADQVMRRPGDGTGLTGACRVFAQVGLARALGLGVVDHAGDRFPLVEAREDLRLLAGVVASHVHHVLLFGVHEAMEDPQPVVALADLLPEVGDRILTVLADGVARPTVPALVEG